MKRLTLLIMFIVALATTRAQEPVDYGIEISFEDPEYNETVRITSENCDNVLHDLYLKKFDWDTQSGITYDPNSNTLTFDRTNSYGMGAGLTDVRVDKTRPSLNIKIQSSSQYDEFWVSISAPESDITIYSDVDNLFLLGDITARSVKYAKGKIVHVDTCTETKKLIIEDGCSFSSGGIQMLCSKADSLVINHGTAFFGSEREIDDAEGLNRIINASYVELNDCKITKPTSGLKYDPQNHVFVRDGEYPQEWLHELPTVLAIEPVEEQPVVDYGITVKDADVWENKFSVKVTSENCDDVLKACLNDLGYTDAESGISYNPKTNVLTICNLQNKVLPDFSLNIERTSLALSLSIEDSYWGPMYDIEAQNCDLHLEADGNESIWGFIKARSLTISKGSVDNHPDGGGIVAQKLIVENGCSLSTGGAETRVPEIDSLIVNHGRVMIGITHPGADIDAPNLLGSYTEMNGCSIILPENGLVYDGAAHHMVRTGEWSGYMDDYILLAPTGDVTNDMTVDVADVNRLIDVILGRIAVNTWIDHSYIVYKKAADVNGDGIIDVSDVNALIDIILGK